MARTIQWAHAIVSEIFAYLAVVALFLCSFSERRRVNPGGGRPILLVHGYFHDCSGWFVMRRRLAAAGLGPIYALHLGRPLSSIREHAETLRACAERIERETGRKDLALVGHSMGGLVAWDYTTRLAPPDKVKVVIALGSPLAGTALAHLGIGACAREMEPGSAFIQDLRRRIVSSPTPSYQAGVFLDHLVFPYTSAFIGSDSTHQNLFHYLGHLGLLFSSRVTNQVALWLRSTE